MQIKTFIRWEWIDGRYQVVREAGFDYCGPMALCDRGQSAATASQSRAQSAQDQANAQAANAAANAGITSYNQRLSDFMRYGRQTFGPTGEYIRDQNTIANTTAAAGSKALEGDLALSAMRTGENTAGYAGTVAEGKRQAARDLTDQLARADANRLAQLTAINQYGVDASKFPSEVQSQLYGSSLSGSSGQSSAAANASRTPGFWDEFAPALVSGAATVGRGFTPHA